MNYHISGMKGPDYFFCSPIRSYSLIRCILSQVLPFIEVKFQYLWILFLLSFCILKRFWHLSKVNNALEVELYYISSDVKLDNSMWSKSQSAVVPQSHLTPLMTTTCFLSRELWSNIPTHCLYRVDEFC